MVKRGKRRALLAVANTLLTIVWHLEKDQTFYQDLGPDYFDRLKGEQTQRYHVKRLEKLGFKVTIEPVQQAA